MLSNKVDKDELASVLERIIKFRDRVISCQPENEVKMFEWGDLEYCSKYLKRGKSSMIQSSYVSDIQKREMLSVAVSQDIIQFFEPVVTRVEGDYVVHQDAFALYNFGRDLERLLSHPKIDVVNEEDGYKVGAYYPANTQYVELDAMGGRFEKGKKVLDEVLNPDNGKDIDSLVDRILSLTAREVGCQKPVSDSVKPLSAARGLLEKAVGFFR